MASHRIRTGDQLQNRQGARPDDSRQAYRARRRGDRVRRREFVTLFGGAAVGWPLAVHSQQPVLRRFGVLMAVAADDPEAKAELAGLHAGLARLGWIGGSTI